MIKTNFLLGTSLIFILMFYNACGPISSDFACVQKEIMQQLSPLEFNTVVNFALGPISMYCVRGIANCAVDDGEEDLHYLRDITKIQVGVYEVTAKATTLPAGNLNKIVKSFKKKGWELFIRARDKDEIALLFYKVKKNEITAFSVVALSDEELVIVELEGDLRQIINKAIQNKGVDMNVGTI